MPVQEISERAQLLRSIELPELSKAQILKNFLTISRGNLVDALGRDIRELRDYQIHIGPYRVCVVCEFPSIKYIMKDAHHKFIKIPLEKRVLGAVMGEGLITAEGETWRRQREAMQPLFGGNHLEKIREITKSMIDESRRSLKMDVSVDLNELTLSWTLEVITRYFTCDIPLGVFPGERSSREYARQFLKAEGQLESTIASNLPLGIGGLFRRRKTTLRESSELGSLFGMIEERVKFCLQNPEEWTLQEKNLSTQLSDFAEIQDEVSTLLVASATTAHQLSFCLWLLGQDSSLQEELAETLRDTDSEGLKNHVLANAVLQETLRLYPPAPLMMRAPGEELNSDFHMYIIPIWRLNREPTLFSRPESFEPDRWIGRDKKGLHLKKIREFIPFGFGPRICIGKQMSTLMSLECLNGIIAHSQWETLTPMAQVKTEILTRAKNHLMAKFFVR